MMPSLLTRRTFASSTGAVLAGLGLAGPAGAAGEISRACEVIHQQVQFAASPARVYRALTTTAQFDHVVRLSAAMRLGMVSSRVPTRVDATPGGAFMLFGGYVSGRTLELVPNRRLVQAWRSGGWPPGAYSIVTFTLAAHGSGTTLSLDHAGFPNGDGADLAQGWHLNYWEPLAKYLA
jgi:uncharacterized protein YndB with AHSA1/START domain